MLNEMGKRAHEAAFRLQRTTSLQRNDSLNLISSELLANADRILEVNQADRKFAKKAHLEHSLIDRLTISEEQLKGIALDVAKIAALPDPLGETFDNATLPNGLKIHKQRVPIGVLAVIYESRPNVTVDIASLAIKSGNAVILRGGSETIPSNRTFVSIIRNCLYKTKLPLDSIQLIEDPNRMLVYDLLKMHEYIDMLIPRGGADLHQFCLNNSRIPVITGGIGICHIYVDENVNIEAALPVIHNAKVQRPTVCNALDTLLVHQAVADRIIPLVIRELGASGVSFRLHTSALPFIEHLHVNAHNIHLSANEQANVHKSKETLPPNIQNAGEDDFDREWLSLVLGIKVVSNLEEAIEHITHHSTAHSDGILTNDPKHANRFVQEVDSAVVYVNTSTRFTDGGQLGLGAEAAISTQRLHARGPMGLRELTTYKWIVEGEYHVRP